MYFTFQEFSNDLNELLKASPISVDALAVKTKAT
jgi:hypothetical protein